jgi:hypothetical protein
MDKRCDTEIMIDVLNEAALRSERDPSSDYSKPRSNRELAIIYDLIEAKYIRGEILPDKDGITPRGAAMGGITLDGRKFRDTLRTQRDEKRFLTRLGRFSWAIGGWLAGVATVVIGAGAKVLFEWLLK